MAVQVPYIGIDFGTSKSTIAWFNEQTGRAEVIENAEGENATPSVVYIGDDGEVLVGAVARDTLNVIDFGDRVIESVKSDLSKNKRYPVNGNPTPVQVAAEILRKLKQDAEDGHFHEPVRHAVITCPAVFDELERDRIREAAMLAGFEYVELFEEPVAAALAYANAGYNVGRNVLVYDLGAGTFDVAVIAREGTDGFRLGLPPAGERCGGDDFDRALYDHCDRLATEQIGHPISSNGEVNLRFLSECRKRKENLSSREEGHFSSLISLPDGTSRQFKHSIKRTEFEQMIRPLLEPTVSLTCSLLQQAASQGFEVDSVILVGGSTRIQLVKAMLKKSLPAEPQRWGKHDVAVALGAASYARLRFAPGDNPPPPPPPPPEAELDPGAFIGLWSEVDSIDFGALSAALDAGASANATDSRGRTALLSASKLGDARIVRLLLDRGADVNKKDPMGDTPLMRAAYGGSPECVRLLLERGADVNAEEQSRHTALSLAKLNGNQEVIDAVLEAMAGTKAARVDIPRHLIDAAILTLWRDNDRIENLNLANLNMIRAALDGEADVNHRDAAGQTALVYAAALGKPDCLKLLIDMGADVNARGLGSVTALHLSALRGDVRGVGLLLDTNVDVDAKDSAGQTPLFCAVSNRRIECAKLLLERGADASATNATGLPALESAVRTAEAECVRLLLDHDANIDACNPARDPLSQNLRLLKTPVDPHIGQTALYVAVKLGLEECVRLLIDRKAKVDVPDHSGMTPIMVAASIGNVKYIEMLIKAGARVNSTDSRRQSSLTLAAGGGHITCVRLLLDNGAEVNLLQDEDESAALKRATTNRHHAIVDMLKAAGAEHLLSDNAASIYRGVVAVGGRIRLTNFRIIFRPHALNFTSDATIVSIADVKLIEPYKSAGMIPNGVRIVLKSGTEHRFIVFGRQALVDAINQRLIS